jgi:hypothetical protein
MAHRIILYWRDIPTQVIVRQGRATAKRELAERFALAVDAAAMTAGMAGSDAYLEHWRRGPTEPCGDDMEAEAEAARLALETEFDQARLGAIVRNGGVAP